jgi:hypothetical protein
MGKAMAYIDLLKHVKFDQLSPEAKSELREKFRKRRKDLQDAINTIDEHLKKLD